MYEYHHGWEDHASGEGEAMFRELANAISTDAIPAGTAGATEATGGAGTTGAMVADPGKKFDADAERKFDVDAAETAGADPERKFDADAGGVGGADPGRKPDVDAGLRVLALNNLGVLSLYKRAFAEADAFFLEAIGLLEGVGNAGEGATIGVAETNRQREGKTNGSERMEEEKAPNGGTMEDGKGITVGEAMVILLVNRGNLLILKKKFKAAEEVLLKAVESTETNEPTAGLLTDIEMKKMNGWTVRLAKTIEMTGTNGARVRLAGALTDLGGLYSAMGDPAEAEKRLQQSVGMLEDMGHVGPRVYAPQLAAALKSMGDLQNMKGAFFLGRSFYERAAGLYENLEEERAMGIHAKLKEEKVAGMHEKLEEERTAEISEKREEERETGISGNLEEEGSSGMYEKMEEEKADGMYEHLEEERAANIGDLETLGGSTWLGMLGGTLLAEGITYLQEGNVPAAKDILLRVRDIYEPLSVAEPEQYEGALSTALNYLGAIYTGENDMVAAEETLTKMSQLQVLQIRFSPLQGPVCAEVLLNLGAGYTRKKDFAEARECYLRALEIFERLEAIDPGVQLSRQAGVLHSLGSLYRDFGHLREAVIKYSRAIEIRRGLAWEYPSLYQPALGRSIHSLGKLQIRMEEKRTAMVTLEEAATIYERLVLEDAAQYEPELLHVYLNLGHCQMEKREYDAAKILWQKVLPLQKRLADADPARYERDLFFTLQNMGHLHIYKKEYREAEKWFTEALELKLNPLGSTADASGARVADVDVANIYRYLGKMHVRDNNPVAAEAMLLHSLKEYLGLESASAALAAPYKIKKEEVLTLLEEIYAGADEEEPSIASLEKRLMVYEALDEMKVGEYRSVIAEILTQLASGYADADRPEDSEFVRLKGNTIYEDLIGGGALEYRPALAESLFWLAILQEHKNDKGSANMNYRYCLELYDMIVEEEGPIYHSKLANILMYYGKFLMRHGQGDMGNEYIRRAVDIARSSVN